MPKVDNLTHQQDLELARRVAEGDTQAFELFYDAYYDRAFRFCLRRVKNEDIVYDIVQQTMERSLRYMNSYRGEASLYTWLCQICRNETAQWYKNSENDPRLNVSMDDNPAIRAIVESGSLAGETEEQARQELAQIVHIVLDGLPPRHAEALERKYLKGLSVDEISAELGISYLATESLLARARRNFKRLLTELTSEPLVEGGS